MITNNKPHPMMSPLQLTMIMLWIANHQNHYSLHQTNNSIKYLVVIANRLQKMVKGIISMRWAWVKWVAISITMDRVIRCLKIDSIWWVRVVWEMSILWWWMMMVRMVNTNITKMISRSQIMVSVHIMWMMMSYDRV